VIENKSNKDNQVWQSISIEVAKIEIGQEKPYEISANQTRSILCKQAKQNQYFTSIKFKKPLFSKT
jgi:hypothetical protein